MGFSESVTQSDRRSVPEEICRILCRILKILEYGVQQVMMSPKGAEGIGGYPGGGADWSRACNFKIQEIRRMFEDEKGRLEDLASACDHLKAGIAAKLATLNMSVNEVASHQQYLKEFTQVDFLNQSPSSESGCLEYILNRIDDLYDVHNNQFELSKAVRQSILSIRFAETSLDSNYKEDEVILDMGSDHKFPADLMIASRTIQDLVVHQMVNHPLASFPENGDEFRQENPPAHVPDDAAMSADHFEDHFPVSAEIGDPDSGSTDLCRRASFECSPQTASAMSALSTSAPAAAAGALTWSQVSKMNCPTKAGTNPVALPYPVTLPKPERLVPETNRPHCYFDCHSVKNNKAFRFVIRVRPDKAPFMSENFIKLTMGKRGFGYKGSKFFRCKPDDHVVMGDFEKNDGSGGRSAYTSRYFLAEQCPLKDHKGAVRMRGMERTLEGRCKVGSQFMVWVGDIHYKEYRYTLVFGEVTQGLKHLQEISRIGMMYSGSETWLLKEDVIITDCGVL